MAKTDFNSVDEYIASQPETVQGRTRSGAERRRGVQGPCIVRGQRGHDLLPALPARPREVDRTHREVPREGVRAEEALDLRESHSQIDDTRIKNFLTAT
jgi:hypothetical protein